MNKLIIDLTKSNMTEIKIPSDTHTTPKKHKRKSTVARHDQNRRLLRENPGKKLYEIDPRGLQKNTRIIRLRRLSRTDLQDEPVTPSPELFIRFNWMN